MKINSLLVLLALIVTYPTHAWAENDISYPDRAWKLGASGSVIALYDIREDGKTENVRIVESYPKFLFDDSVKKQIYGWRFPKGKSEKDVKIKVDFQKN